MFCPCALINVLLLYKTYSCLLMPCAQSSGTAAHRYVFARAIWETHHAIAHSFQTMDAILAKICLGLFWRMASRLYLLISRRRKKARRLILAVLWTVAGAAMKSIWRQPCATSHAHGQKSHLICAFNPKEIRNCVPIGYKIGFKSLQASDMNVALEWTFSSHTSLYSIYMQKNYISNYRGPDQTHTWLCLCICFTTDKISP